MSPKLCIARCITADADFASIIGGTCYCSNDGPLNTGGSGRCSTPCPANAGLFCGGSGAKTAISVFRRAVKLIEGPLPVIPEPTGWRYSGCFFGDAYIAAATKTGKVYTYAANAAIGAQSCTTSCGSSYAYSAMYKNKCYCSNTAPGASLLAGLGQCTSQPCYGNTGQSCGGESNWVPALPNTYSIMIVVYIKAPTLLITAPPKVNTTAPQGWTYYGCYYGALYLLDTIFGGFQATGALDTVPSMSADRCITLCLKANLNFNYAMILRGACFCTARAPTEDLLSKNQSLCSEPCPGNPTQRCGGSDQGFSLSLGYRLVNIIGRLPKPPLVSGFQFKCHIA